jgi:ubiquinone/menaquinone biosynthesis C-methylase UbiE
MIKQKMFKSFLEHWPALYSFIAKVYSEYGYSRLKEYLLGTKVREKEWITKHIHEGNDWIEFYWDFRHHSHRPLLIEKISKFFPHSILEIGCNSGPNLYLLARKFPDAEIRGIDINPAAVQKGNDWLAEEGISNVKLLVGKADELGQFQDKSFDVVFTDAVLIYIGPDKIKDVMREMVRITRKALILVEWHSFEPKRKDPEGLGVYHRGYWKRDYAALLRKFVLEEQIRVTKITEDIWPDKNWKEVGAVIEIVMERRR